VTPQQRECAGFGTQPAHQLPWDEEHFANWALDPNRKTIRCRDCDREYRRSRRAGQTPRRTVDLSTLQFSDEDLVPEEEARRAHEYVPDPNLMALWQSVVRGTLKYGDPPANLVFFGPSGSGKTDGARYLAAAVGLPLTKVDAASMTDPDSWFGTREIVVEDGHPVTKYVPSAFVESIQQPGVTFIDEVSRVDDQHRNVLLPLTDGTGKVTNPLTGEIVERHEHAFVIMAGNRGLQFTGTSAVDPAFTSRAYVVEFDYLDRITEQRVIQDATGVDDNSAYVFARFAEDSRVKAQNDPDFNPISTREVIMACRQVRHGLDRDLAAKFAIINAASGEGGSASVRHELENIWNGVRITKEELDADGNPVPTPPVWTCPIHNVSGPSPTGGDYLVCTEMYCDNTSASKSCDDCGHLNEPGVNSFCAACGSPLT
jgi:hypothetical protein